MNEGSDLAFVFTGEASAGWAKAEMAEIHHALCAIGVEARLVDIEAPSAEDIAAAASRRPVFGVDGNHRIAFTAPIRRFSVMVDHPCTRLLGLGQTRPGLEVLGWVDETHPEAAAALGIPVPSIFLPHAGPDPIAEFRPMRERDIDVFFAGALTEPVDRAGWTATHSEVAPVLADAIFDAAERMEQARQPALPAFLAACQAHGINVGQSFALKTFCASVNAAIEISEMNRRHAVLMALPDVRVVIASGYLPLGLKDRTNLRYLGYIDDFAEIRRLMARSKIVLNTTNKFPAGSHERVWFAMAEGAVVLTDHSTFLAQDFADGRDILFLPQQRQALTALCDLRSRLAADAALEALARRAGEVYAAKHTWTHRIVPLYQAMRALRIG